MYAGVDEQRGHRLHQARAVADDRGRGGGGESEWPDVVRSGRTGLPYRFRDHCREVRLSRVQGPARVQPGGQEPVLHETRHPGRLGRDAVPGRAGGDAVTRSRGTAKGRTPVPGMRP
ncbi:hypothetical protein [Streptomyces sp. NPDC002550]